MINDPDYIAAGAPGRLHAQFYFNLESLPGSRFDGDHVEDQYCDFKRNLFKRYDVKMGDRFWTSLDAGHPRLGEIVDALERLRDGGTAAPARGTLGIWIEDGGDPRPEWFVLQPRASFPLKEWGDPPKVSAGDVPPGLHVAGGAMPFVSETFRSFVEDRALTGISFHWAQDVGRYRAPQWFQPVATRCVGRGLDHPWFDWNRFTTGYREAEDAPVFRSSTLAAMGRAFQKQHADRMEALRRERAAADLTAWRRFGVRQFSTVFLAPEWTSGDEHVDRLVRLFPAAAQGLDHLAVVSFPRVARDHLPDTDFAFLWDNPRPGARDQDGDPGDLCVNRRTRDLLVEAGLAEPEEFLGVLVVSTPPADRVFDRPDWPIPGHAADERLGARQKTRDEALAVFLETPKPVRTPSLKRSLTLLRHAKAKEPERFGKRGSAQKVAAAESVLAVRIPAAWQSVLKTVDGFECGSDDVLATVVSAADLPDEHRAFHQQIEKLDLTAPTHWLHVGHFFDGDMLTLDLATATDKGECGVLRVSHETHEVDRRWDSVAAFLEEALADT